MHQRHKTYQFYFEPIFSLKYFIFTTKPWLFFPLFLKVNVWELVRSIRIAKFLSLTYLIWHTQHRFLTRQIPCTVTVKTQAQFKFAASHFWWGGSRAKHPYKEEVRGEEASKDEQGAPGQTKHKEAASRGWKWGNMAWRNAEELPQQPGIRLGKVKPCQK